MYVFGHKIQKFRYQLLLLMGIILGIDIGNFCKIEEKEVNPSLKYILVNKKMMYVYVLTKEKYAPSNLKS